MFGLSGFFGRKHITRSDRLEKIFNQCIGKVVICEDGALRKIENITAAHMQHPVKEAWKKGLAIINEGDPLCTSGHYVTLLTLELLARGEPPPSPEARAAFRRAAAHITTANLKDIYESQRKGKMQLDFND